MQPVDAIEWLFVRDITDLSWEIQREKRIKRNFIEDAEEGAVASILTPERPEGLDWGEPIPGADEAYEAASQWARDPKARRRIDKELAELGHDAPSILSMALEDNDSRIDAFDKRIASYELRRIAALRAIEQYSEKLARRLEAASSEIIEGEFTEAAE